ncbi:hypothetical protein Tco_0674406 [Tanacetum coccineum]
MVGFAGEIAKPLGKIDLEVCFGNEGLSKLMPDILSFAFAALSLQHNFGKTRVKSTACYSINYPRDDQVPHSEGNSNSGDSVNDYRRMQTSRRKTNTDGKPARKVEEAHTQGFSTSVFLDAYKGYHQIQMAREDEEKTAFYTEQGTYCYLKMPFGLKNAGATYQRLVDSQRFQSPIGKNL